MIQCSGLTKVYRNGENSTVALDGVSFEIRDGEFVAIMGPSGSGKSTLMNILGALDTPTSGKYVLDGRDVSGMSDDELSVIRRDRIGFVFQSFNLLPRTSVMRNVSLPLIYQEVSKKDRQPLVETALRAVDIPEDRWGHLSNELSGGQVQRVAIARAIVNNPSLLLADEPTGNLDTRTGVKVMEIFRTLNERDRRTIVLITHEEEIAEYADRIILIRDGRIAEDRPRRRESGREFPNQSS